MQKQDMNLREAGLVTYWDGSLILIHTIFGLEDASCLAALLQVGIETAEGEGLSPIDVFFFSMSPPQVCPTLRDLLFVWHVLPLSNFVYWLILHTLQAKRKDTVTSSKSSTDQCRLVGLQIQPAAAAAGDGIVGGNRKRQLCSDSGDCCGGDIVSNLNSWHVKPGVLSSTVLQSVGQGSVGGIWWSDHIFSTCLKLDPTDFVKKSALGTNHAVVPIWGNWNCFNFFLQLGCMSSRCTCINFTTPFWRPFSLKDLCLRLPHHTVCFRHFSAAFSKPCVRQSAFTLAKEVLKMWI